MPPPLHWLASISSNDIEIYQVTEEGAVISERQRNSSSSTSSELPSAFPAFLQVAGPLLYAVFRSSDVGAADAEDLAQDCMERLIRYRGCKTDELYLLLHRIVRNRLADFRRSSRAQMEQLMDSVDSDLEDSNPWADPYRHAAARQKLSHFYQALLGLPDRTREAYLLNRVAGMSYSQIARRRGITLKTVEKQISRALQDLRRALSPMAFYVEEC